MLNASASEQEQVKAKTSQLRLILGRNAFAIIIIACVQN